MSGTVTLTLTDYQGLVDKNATAFDEVAKLRTQLDKQIAADEFWPATKDMAALARFMMAHLAPEAAHGWPTGALRRFADYLTAVPGVPNDDLEWANDAKVFAREATMWDAKREKFWAEQAVKVMSSPSSKERAVAYLAHPVSGDPRGNAARAKRWLRYLIDTTPFAVIAPWIDYVEVLDDENVEHRKRGMSDDLLVLRRCDLLIAVGGRISSGMAEEIRTMQALGKPVITLIEMGEEPPEDRKPLEPSLWLKLAQRPEAHAP